MLNSAPGDSFLGAFSLRPPSHRGLRRVLPVDSGVRRFAIDSPLEGDGFEPSVPPVGDAIFWDPPEPGDDKLARLPEPDSDDRQGRVYRAPSEAGPGNDINAGSPGFQKALTRDPASLVAGRALAGRRPACDTAIVGHRNFAIEHDLACVPGPCRGAIHQDSAGRLPGQRSARDAPATPGRWPRKVGNLRDNYASPEHLSARGTAPWLPGRCSPIRKRPSAASKINLEYS